jgi:hypothetical protein
MSEDFADFIRRTMLAVWRERVGWRRFFIGDWWRLKLRMKGKED